MSRNGSTTEHVSDAHEPLPSTNGDTATDPFAPDPFDPAFPVASGAIPEPPSTSAVAATPAAKRSRHLRGSIAIGLVSALGVGAAGGIYIATRPAVWTAEASVVVLPAKGFDSGVEANLYETLSRGQVVETFAEIARNPQLLDRSASTLKIDASGSTVETNSVPATSVILVRGSASTKDAAEKLTQSTTDLAMQYFDQLSQPFRVEKVESAAGSAVRSGTSRSLLIVAVAGLALLTGVTLQQAAHLLFASRRRSRMLAAIEAGELVTG